MQTIEEIKKELRRGDLKFIAELTGYSYVYVKKVMQGSRKNEKIFETAQKIISKRQELKGH